MTLETELVKAADTSPPEMNCHRSVLHWLVEANAVTAAKCDQLVQSIDAMTWANIMANYNDTAYDRDGLQNAAAGTVLGFFMPNGVLQHSMVTMGNGGLAGVNNANVLKQSIVLKVGTAYVKATVAQLDWVDNTRVGINQCVIRGVSATDWSTRVNRVP